MRASRSQDRSLLTNPHSKKRRPKILSKPRYLLALLLLLSFTIGVSRWAQREGPPPDPLPSITGAPIDAPAQSSVATDNFGVKIAPTDPEARAALAQEAPPPEVREGFQSVSFAQLSDFPYPTDENGALLPEATLPSEISALHGSKVALSGFLVPIEFQEDKVSGVILVRNQLLCCYGEEPKLNEWVLVTVDPPVEAVTDVPVTFFGTFEAGPDVEEGQVISLYRMNATEMETMEY